MPDSVTVRLHRSKRKKVADLGDLRLWTDWQLVGGSLVAKLELERRIPGAKGRSKWATAWCGFVDIQPQSITVTNQR
jgi:hypothetical protein